MASNNILTPMFKSFRIFRLLDRNDNYFERNIKLKKVEGVCFMPLVKTRSEIGDLVQKFFGYKGYYLTFPYYLFNYKFIYQPSLIAGRKRIMQNRVKIMRAEAQFALPKLRKLPSHKILGNKNAILDYTDQFNLLFPTQAMMTKQPVIKYAENIFPEIITRFGISYEKPELFKWTSRYVSTQVKPYLYSHFSHIIIPIPVDIVDTKLINMYIDYNKPIPLTYKRNTTNLQFMSLMRMVYRAYCNDTEEISSPEYTHYVEELINHNVVFLFYNKKFAFTVNFEDLRERNVNFRQFRNLFKSRLIILVSNNIGLEADDNLDRLIEENAIIDETEITTASQDIDITIDKSTGAKQVKIGEKETSNNEIKDDTKEKRDIEINDLINKNITHIKKKDTKDYKKRSDTLLKLINKMETSDSHTSLFDSMADSVDPIIQPKEDHLKDAYDKIEERQKNIIKNIKVTTVSGIDILSNEPAIKNNIVENTKDVEYDDDEEELIVNEDEYDESGFKIENQSKDIETEEDSYDDEITYEDSDLDDVSEEIIDENRTHHITVSSDGSISDEEKKELLKEINKKQIIKKSDKQLRRIELVKDKYKSIKLKDERSLEDIIHDVKSLQIETKVNKVDTVLDKTLLTNNLQDFEKSYIKNSMQRDIIKVLKSFSNSDKSNPLYILDYKEEDTSDRFTAKKTVRVKFEDSNQKQHTICFDVPIPQKDGTLLINGTKKVLKKQITLRPLIKIAPDKLAITTFFNKVLLFRQGTILNRKTVLLKRIVEEILIHHKETFELKYGNNLKMNKNYLTSIEYDELAKYYHKFIIGKRGNRTVVFFNQKEIREEIKTLNIPYVFIVSKLPIAIDYNKKEVIELDMTDLNKSVIDYIMEIIEEKSYYADIETMRAKVKAPKRRVYSRITIQSFDIPLIVFLSALYGISNIMRLSGLKYTFTTERLAPDAPEREWLSITFKDGTLYYPEYPYANSLLFNGLNEMSTEEYDFEYFDEHVPFMDYAAKVLKTRNVYKGWFAFKELFIDDVATREALEYEGLPTDFLELFLYANDLLCDNEYINETEARSYRIRSLELISVALYKEIAEQYAIYIRKEGRANQSISIKQECILIRLTDSQILETYDELNPINELKAKCACTVKGNGLAGANTKHGFGIDRRAFGEDAVGIYSETNVDNGNIGIVKQLTNNVKIINTRGYLDATKDPEKISKITASQRMSPDELIMPAITRKDSPNRVGFSGGQWKHTMPIYNGGDTPLVGSGYEKVIAYDIGDNYALKSEISGKVIDINEELKIITIEDTKGTRVSYNYGTKYTKNGNIYMENNLELNIKLGQKIEEGDILAYSKEFFTKNATGDIIFTMGVLARIAVMDDYFTEEDSSLVSESLSKRMSSTVTHKKVISISSKANIIKMTALGEYVKDGDVIMLFEDERDEDVSNVDITSILNMLGDADESAIEKLRYHAPKASATGTITKLELYWTGEIEDMSESVQKLVKNYIKTKKQEFKYKEEISGKKIENIDGMFAKAQARYGKVNGIDVDEENGLIIEYYITHTLPYGPGDKLSFYPSIKSVTPQIVPEQLSPYCEDGPIDTVMGFVSMSNRQVNSPYFIGTLGKILFDRSKQIAAKYLGKK